jgi:putative ABC transport system permease protein
LTPGASSRVTRHGRTRFALRNLLRDLRSGELAVLVLALLVAVGSLTAGRVLTSRIGRAVEQQAGQVLAADLRLESSRDVTEEYDRTDSRARARGRAGDFDAERRFQWRAVIAGRAARRRRRVSALRRLKGRRPAVRAVARTRDIPAPGQAWADSRLLRGKLEAGIGSSLHVGATSVVTRVLDYRPDKAARVRRPFRDAA